MLTQNKKILEFTEIFTLRCESKLATTHRELANLILSIDTNSYQIFRSNDGTPIGYIAWANVSLDMLWQMNMHYTFPLFFHEWKDGNIRYIHDVLISPSHIKKCLFQLRSSVKDIEHIAYMRGNKMRYRNYGVHMDIDSVLN